MKKSVQTLHLAFLSILFICQHANAQTHKSYISRGNESLPMNRAAFIFCYFDVSGQKVFASMMDESEKRLDLSEYQRGIYLIKVGTKTYKILKQ
ncbi:MAG: T9SS type A sorting domain-containing protein [Sphingobacteriales bacterium]|nr:T9SS type A sorting domain-containing protein [Sphingobacteriales bacterium]MBP8192846.1 T9SS type A sorting domain-containing protein [Chitinophagales bacterium]